MIVTDREGGKEGWRERGREEGRAAMGRLSIFSFASFRVFAFKMKRPKFFKVIAPTEALLPTAAS